MVTTVPLKVAIEKLRGFVADHKAELKSIEDSRILLNIFGDRSQKDRRRSDRQIPLVVELNFTEQRVRQSSSGTAASPSQTRTKIQVVMRPKRNRDRRQANAVTRARQLLASLRSYLMAIDDHSQTDDETVVRCATHMLVP
jgi:hypothetical protein